VRFASIVGTCLQFVNLAPVSRALRQQHQELVIHTDQHYDYSMSAQLFDELALPATDYNLGVGSGTRALQTGRMLEASEQVLLKERPDWVAAYGDMNPMLAGARNKRSIPEGRLRNKVSCNES
jgi:UDP-GlcNAc3NAcA epimerase